MTELTVDSANQLEVIDPFQESINALIVVAFPKSSSKNFSFALAIAQGASKYSIAEIGGSKMHFAIFEKKQADAGRASALLSYVAGWKGVMVFSNGKLVSNNYMLSEVISCYLESCSCRDSKAHCQKVIDDPFSDEVADMSMSFSIRLVEEPVVKKAVDVDRYAFPCKLLFNRFQFQKDHPSSPQDQIQAAGVKHNCDICPNFYPDDFKRVGVRTILKDY